MHSQIHTSILQHRPQRTQHNTKRHNQPTHTDTDTHTNMHARTHTHTDTCVCVHTHTHTTHTYARTPTYSCAHPHPHTHVHTHTYTWTHTHVHTYTHEHTLLHFLKQTRSLTVVGVCSCTPLLHMEIMPQGESQLNLVDLQIHGQIFNTSHHVLM